MPDYQIVWDKAVSAIRQAFKPVENRSTLLRTSYVAIAVGISIASLIAIHSYALASQELDATWVYPAIQVTGAGEDGCKAGDFKIDPISGETALQRAKKVLDCIKTREQLHSQIMADERGELLKRSWWHFWGGSAFWPWGILTCFALIVTFGGLLLWNRLSQRSEDEIWLILASEVVEADLLRGTPAKEKDKEEQTETQNASANQKPLNEEEQVKEAGTEIISPIASGLLRSVVYDPRFEYVLRQVESRCNQGEKLSRSFLEEVDDYIATRYQGPYDSSGNDQARSEDSELGVQESYAVRRVFLRRIARDPDFHYLLEEHLQRRKQWSLSPQSILNRFKKNDDGSRPLGASAGGQIWVLLLAGALPIGYTAMKVDQIEKDHQTETTAQLEARKDVSDAAITSASEKDIERDYYYMSETSAPAATTGSGAQQGAMPNIDLVCEPDQKVEIRDGKVHADSTENGSQSSNSSMEQLFNAMPAGGVTEKKIETNGRITVTCRPRQVVSMAGDKRATEGETRVEAVSMPGGDVLASFDLTKGGANDPSVTLRYRTKTGYNSLERTFQLVLNRDRNRRKVPDPIGIKVTETTSGANGAVSTAYVYSDRSYYNSLLNSDLSVLESHGPALGFWGNGRLVIRISPRAEELQPVPSATQTKPH